MPTTYLYIHVICFYFFCVERVNAFHVGVRVCVYICVCMLARGSYLALVIVSYGIRAHARAFRVCVFFVFVLCACVYECFVCIYIHIYTHIAINMYTLCVDTIHRYDPDFIVDDCISVN